MYVLMPRNTAVRNMRPPLGLVPDVSGVVYLRAATSKLQSKAKMSSLMVGTGGHPGNVGSDGLGDDKLDQVALRLRSGYHNLAVRLLRRFTCSSDRENLVPSESV